MPVPRIERSIQLSIHNKTLEDIVAAHLYSMGFLRDAEVILCMDVGPTNEEGIHPIRVDFIEERPVKLIKHK